MVCLGNSHRSVVFEIASKYCTSDSFVDYEGYSFSSKGFFDPAMSALPIIVKQNSPSVGLFTPYLGT